MNILVTGSNGFIGKNLIVRLKELSSIKIYEFNRSENIKNLEEYISIADVIFHLAGVNRPSDENDFYKSNEQLTKDICNFVKKSPKKPHLIYTSSTQAELTNPYGKSKLNGEIYVKDLKEKNGNRVSIYRLPGVFGKWSKPNYNSVVSTFCFNIANDIPIKISDPNVIINLIYIDDLVDNFIGHLSEVGDENIYEIVKTQYKVSLEDLAKKILSFKESRSNLTLDEVGRGFGRALYATYVSYLNTNNFQYKIESYTDQRGKFLEFFKTKHNGQVSFFTALPGATRGGHYHHTKTEKFLIISGCAKFSFRNILTKEYYEIITNENEDMIIETIPGWAHDITNIGDKKLVALLWANEIFDRNKPDTLNYNIHEKV